MAMNTILALDMATKTGWATSGPSGVATSGVENFRKRAGDSRGMIFIRFEAWLSEICRSVSPRVIVYERPHARGRAANEVLNGMLAYLAGTAEKMGIEYADCPSSTLKLFATGKGNASKVEMMAAYRAKWGREPIDDNESDARWLLEWGRSQFCTGGDKNHDQG